MKCARQNEMDELGVIGFPLLYNLFSALLF